MAAARFLGMQPGGQSVTSLLGGGKSPWNNSWESPGNLLGTSWGNWWGSGRWDSTPEASASTRTTSAYSGDTGQRAVAICVPYAGPVPVVVQERDLRGSNPSLILPFHPPSATERGTGRGFKPGYGPSSGFLRLNEGLPRG